MERAESVRDDRRVAPRAPPNALQTGRSPGRGLTRSAPRPHPPRLAGRTPRSPRVALASEAAPRSSASDLSNKNARHGSVKKKQQNVAPCEKSLCFSDLTKTIRVRCLFSLDPLSSFANAKRAHKKKTSRAVDVDVERPRFVLLLEPLRELPRALRRLRLLRLIALCGGPTARRGTGGGRTSQRRVAAVTFFF